MAIMKPTTSLALILALSCLGGALAAGCSWANHCAGAPCQTYDDCSDSLICVAGKCATGGPTPKPTVKPTPAPTRAPTPAPTASCSWAGHCVGAACGTDNDCSDVLTCVSGKCSGSTPAPTPGTAPTPKPTLKPIPAPTPSSGSGTIPTFYYRVAALPDSRCPPVQSTQDWAQVSGSCGYTYGRLPGNPTLGVAVYNAKARGLCGKQVVATYGSTSLTLTVIDDCPACSDGHLDMSLDGLMQLFGSAKLACAIDTTTPKITWRLA